MMEHEAFRRARGASVAAVALVVLDSTRGSSPSYRGQVHAIAEAKFWTVSGQPDEIVRPVNGSISVGVAELDSSERFRVVTSHGEIEVRGTSFDVVAKDDRLEAVQVHSGTVEVRTELETRLLHAGERWTSPQVSAVERSVVEPLKSDAVAGGPVRESRARRDAPVRKDKPIIAAPTKEPPAPQQTAYETGWMYLRTGAHREAVSYFETAVAEADTPSLKEDARYFLAVSLARAGELDSAIETFELFLAEHASSPHSGEEAAALGWLRYDRGQYAEAKALFLRAIDSSASRAKTSGRDGLEALRRNRARAGGE